MRLPASSAETQVIVLFPKANLCNWHHVMQLARIEKHILSPGYTPSNPHACTCTHTCAHKLAQTHLVLLQGSLLLHVRTVFAGDNSFDISHRHCREDRSEWTTSTTTTTTSSTSQMGGCFIQTIKSWNSLRIHQCACTAGKTGVNTDSQSQHTMLWQLLDTVHTHRMSLQCR